MTDEKKEMDKKDAEFRNDVMFILIFLILTMQILFFIFIVMVKDEPKKIRAAIEDTKDAMITKAQVHHSKEMIAIDQVRDKIITEILTEIMPELKKKKEKE